MRSKKIVSGFIFAPVVLFLLMAGCANPYRDHYMSMIEKWPAPVSRSLLPPQGPATLVSSNDMKTDAHTLLQNGYVLLGRSKFRSQALDETLALQQAATIGAWLVLVNQKYDKTITVQVPQVVTSPDQTTTTTRTIVTDRGFEKQVTDTQTVQGTTSVNFVPEDVAYYDYAATYWAKAKPAIFGVLADGPQSNDPMKPAAAFNGLMVKVVITNSPAYQAGIQEGDILTTFAGAQLSSEEQLFDMATDNAGKPVTVGLERNGEPVQLEVNLGSGQ